MASMRFRLAEDDQREFGGPEWVTLDPTKINAMRARELERVEKELGHPLKVLTDALRGEATVVGVRALVWMARYQAGLKTPFRDFNIHTLQVDVEILPEDTEEDDTDVPLSDSPSSSESSG